MADLGLTLVQARIYTVLAKSGILTARATAKNAKVAPQDIYRILNELSEKGLVERIIDKPTRYMAMPLEEGLNLLLKRRKEKIVDLEKTVVQLSELSKAFPGISEEKIGGFIIIPEKESIEKMVNKIFNTAKVSIDMINDMPEVLIAHDKHLEPKRRALKNGVKIRDILCLQRGESPLPKGFIDFLKENQNIFIKSTKITAPIKLIIKDKSELFMSTIIKSDTLSQPFLWSNNEVLLHMAQQWYDRMWLEANGDITAL